MKKTLIGLMIVFISLNTFGQGKTYPQFTEATTMSSDDLFLIWKTSLGANRKLTLQNLQNSLILPMTLSYPLTSSGLSLTTKDGTLSAIYNNGDILESGQLSFNSTNGLYTTFNLDGSDFYSIFKVNKNIFNYYSFGAGGTSAQFYCNNDPASEGLGFGMSVNGVLSSNIVAFVQDSSGIVINSSRDISNVTDNNVLTINVIGASTPYNSGLNITAVGDKVLPLNITNNDGDSIIGFNDPGGELSFLDNLGLMHTGQGSYYIGQSFTKYGVTAQSLTSSSAALNLGTGSAVMKDTLRSGLSTYLIRSQVVLKYNAATFAANRTVTLKLRRINKTATDLANSTITLTTDITTTVTGTFMVVNLPDVIYTAISGASDIIQIFGGLDTAPTAGSLDVTQGYIMATKIY